MAKYVNFNASSLPPLNSDSGIFSRVMTAGSSLSTNTMLLIGSVLVLVIFAVIYYFYYVIV